MLYFLNIVANLTDRAEFLKYITPFGYADGSEIVSTSSLDIALVLTGMAYAVIAVILAYGKYTKKDIG